MKRNGLLVMAVAAMLILLQACNFPRPTPTAQAGIPVTGSTATPSQTVLSVRSMANCRTGPGSAYDRVFSLQPGSNYLVIGRYISGNFWIIANPAGGACWVSGKKAVVSGDISRLPVYPAPAKPTSVPRP